MQGDLNKFTGQIIHELNLRKDIEQDGQIVTYAGTGYNLGLSVAIAEIKKKLKNWKE